MFKKLLVLIAASFFTLQAASIDANTAKTEFTAFKTAKKLAVNGSINNVKYKFKKKNGSISAMLKGSTASFSMDDINLANPVKNANFKKFFTDTLKDKKVKVTFKNVTEGEGLGIILARIKINGVNRNIPLQYVEKNKTLVITGLLDLDDYKCSKALSNLSKNVKEHLGLSWSQVELKFSVNLK